MSSPGLTGRSSTRRLISSSTAVSGILDGPLKAGRDSGECDQHFSKTNLDAPAARLASGSCSVHPLKMKRAQGMPGEGLTHGPPAIRKAGGSHHRFSQIIRHSLRDVLRLIRDLPGDRAFLPPSLATFVTPASLASASGGQDHTISPSASAPFVRTKTRARRCLRPSHPDPRP